MIDPCSVLVYNEAAEISFEIPPNNFKILLYGRVGGICKRYLTVIRAFFYSGAFNPRLFFYPLSAGHFYCTSGYRVDRSSFDSILIAYIVRGTFSFLYQGRELMIKRGCIISPASVIPAHICELFELIKAREAISISRLSSRIYTLITGLFEETMDSEGENSLSFAAVRYMKAHYSEK